MAFLAHEKAERLIRDEKQATLNLNIQQFMAGRFPFPVPSSGPPLPPPLLSRRFGSHTRPDQATSLSLPPPPLDTVLGVSQTSGSRQSYAAVIDDSTRRLIALLESDCSLVGISRPKEGFAPEMETCDSNVSLLLGASWARLITCSRCYSCVRHLRGRFQSTRP